MRELLFLLAGLPLRMTAARIVQIGGILGLHIPRHLVRLLELRIGAHYSSNVGEKSLGRHCRQAFGKSDHTFAPVNEGDDAEPVRSFPSLCAAVSPYCIRDERLSWTLTLSCRLVHHCRVSVLLCPL